MLVAGVCKDQAPKCETMEIAACYNPLIRARCRKKCGICASSSKSKIHLELLLYPISDCISVLFFLYFYTFIFDRKIRISSY